MGKIKRKIYAFFFSLFKGLHNADSIAFSSNITESDNFKGGIEVKDEQNSVYKDLVNHQVTDAVKELRYNMYVVSEESKKYKYTGNGSASKNDIFKDNINIENSGGEELILIQDRKTPDTLKNQFNGVVINDELMSIKEDDDNTFVIERDFTPRFQIETYVTSVVLKKSDEGEYYLDMYVPIFNSQFDKIKRIFANEMERLYNGDSRSEIIDINNITFITFNAYGVPDFRLYNFLVKDYVRTLKYNGKYIVRFIVDPMCNGVDLTEEFYDEKADEKNKTNASRENSGELVIDFNDAVTINESDKYDVEQAINLIDEGKEQLSN